MPYWIAKLIPRSGDDEAQSPRYANADGSLSAKKLCYIAFKVHVDIFKAKSFILARMD
jgi:hypothetical protein